MVGINVQEQEVTDAIQGWKQWDCKCGASCLGKINTLHGMRHKSAFDESNRHPLTTRSLLPEAECTALMNRDNTRDRCRKKLRDLQDPERSGLKNTHFCLLVNKHAI
jgi:hypothetical protein